MKNQKTRLHSLDSQVTTGVPQKQSSRMVFRKSYFLTFSIHFALAIVLSSCGNQDIMQTAETYENIRGFQPIDPTEYLAPLEIYKDGSMVQKFARELNKEEILDFLTNETVYVSIEHISGDLQGTFSPVGVSLKGESYRVTLDYMKSSTIRDKDGEGNLAGYQRLGVGLRIIAFITTFEAGINLTDLFSIGMAAKANKASGTLLIEVIGIRGEGVTSVIPIPSEINQSTIQSAIQAMTTIKSQLYQPSVDLFPQVMALKSATPKENDNYVLQKEASWAK